MLLAGIAVGVNLVEKGRSDFGVELRAGAATYFGKGILERPGTSERQVESPIVESLGYGDDPRSLHSFDLGPRRRYYQIVEVCGRVAQVDRATDF